MKRRMINLFIAVSTLFVFIACSNEEDSVQAIKTGICLNIKTGGNTRSSVVPGTDPENEIKKCLFGSFLMNWMMLQQKECLKKYLHHHQKR